MHNLPIPPQDGRVGRPQDVEYVLVPEAVDGHEWGLRDYLKIIQKRKWFVILSVCLIVPFVALNLAVQKPVYQATATVLIEKANPKILSIEEVLTPESSPDFYHTQYEIIKSRGIAEQVVDALQLHRKVPEEEPRLAQTMNAIKALPAELFYKAWNTVKTALRESGLPVENPTAGVAEPDSLAVRRQRAITKLQLSLQVEPRRDTQLVDIVLQGHNREDVAQQVNMVAEAYVRQNLENKLEASRKAIVWLKREARMLKEKIHNAELALQDFKKKKDIIDLSDSASNESQSIAVKRLDLLHTSYAEASNARQVLQVRLEALNQLLTKSLDDVIDDVNLFTNSLLDSLKSRYVSLRIQQDLLSEKYKEKHPKVVQIKAEIENVKEMILREVRKEIAKVKEEYALSLKNEQLIESELNRQQGSVMALNNDIMRYSELKRDLEVDKELYLAVSKRLAETTLTEALETNNIKVVERALVPRKPVPAGRLKKLMLSLAMAVGLGVGLALLVERLDRRFGSVDAAEQALGIPFLGFIPHFNARRNRPIALYEPGSLAAEAYRTLRTWIQLSKETPIKTLLITSATAGEGKSTTAANLAISFAQLGRLVAVVDADLRRPAAHRIFNVTHDRGLRDVLTEGAAWEPLLQETALENLKVLPTGGIPPNPAELLSTTRMQELLKGLKEAFDLVIVDAPVVLTIPDVAILTPAMEGMLLVHHPGKGDKQPVLEAKKILDRAGAPLLGVIFNNVRPKEQKYYYYPHKYYEYGYAPAQSSRQRPVDVPLIDMRPSEGRDKWK